MSTDFSPLSIDFDSEQTSPAQQVQPIGVDLAFDFRTMELSYAGDIRTVSGAAVIRQWVLVALATTRDEEAIYSSSFGSDIRSRMRGGMSLAEAQSALPSLISQALTAHDRISGVRDIVVSRAGADDHVTVGFIVQMDDGSEIPFPQVLIS